MKDNLKIGAKKATVRPNWVFFFIQKKFVRGSEKKKVALEWSFVIVTEKQTKCGEEFFPLPKQKLWDKFSNLPDRTCVRMCSQDFTFRTDLFETCWKSSTSWFRVAINRPVWARTLSIGNSFQVITHQFFPWASIISFHSRRNFTLRQGKLEFTAEALVWCRFTQKKIFFLFVSRK